MINPPNDQPTDLLATETLLIGRITNPICAARCRGKQQCVLPVSCVNKMKTSQKGKRLSSTTFLTHLFLETNKTHKSCVDFSNDQNRKNISPAECSLIPVNITNSELVETFLASNTSFNSVHL